MRHNPKSAARLAGILFIAAAGAALLGNVVPIPFSDPPLSSHCACSGGACPLDANGRRCSCGCARAVDTQPLSRLDSLLDTACTDGAAGPYPCNEIDLMAFLPARRRTSGSTIGLESVKRPFAPESASPALRDPSSPRHHLVFGSSVGGWNSTGIFAGSDQGGRAI
jgi:hypothetical protein